MALWSRRYIFYQVIYIIPLALWKSTCRGHVFRLGIRSAAQNLFQDCRRPISSYCMVADMLRKGKRAGRSSRQASRNDGIIPASNVSVRTLLLGHLKPQSKTPIRCSVQASCIFRERSVYDCLENLRVKG